MTYTLGGMEFKTKKAVTETAKKIAWMCVERAAVKGEWFDLKSLIGRNDPEFAFLFDLLKVNVTKGHLATDDVLAFTAEIDPWDHAPHFEVIFQNASRLRFSYKKSAASLGTPEHRVKLRAALIKEQLVDAFRNAVFDQTQDFKRSCSAWVCEVCGEATEDPHTDHFPTKFTHLVSTFLETWQGRVPKEFTKCGDAYGPNPYASRFCDEDTELERAWVAYHREHAEYRLLCGRCNTWSA